MNLSEYILLPREKRIEHIDLESECITRKKWLKSTFLDFHNIEDDVQNWKYNKIERCHLCDHNSRNGGCVNPRHVYIGTTKENAADRNQDYLIESGRRLGSIPKSDETKQRMSDSAKLRTDRDKQAEKVRHPVGLVHKKTGQVYHFKSQKEAADELGINMGNLSLMINGQRKSAGGFTLAEID